MMTEYQHNDTKLPEHECADDKKNERRIKPGETEYNPFGGKKDQKKPSNEDSTGKMTAEDFVNYYITRNDKFTIPELMDAYLAHHQGR